MGVCAGLANCFGGDPLVWRLIFVLGTVFGFGSLVVVYLAIGLLAGLTLRQRPFARAARPHERKARSRCRVSNTSTPSRRLRKPTTA